MNTTEKILSEAKLENAERRTVQNGLYLFKTHVSKSFRWLLKLSVSNAVSDGDLYEKMLIREVTRMCTPWETKKHEIL